MSSIPAERHAANSGVSPFMRPEDESPYQSVARILMPRQNPWSPARLKGVNDEMSISPRHALAAHRPLGAVNRVRKTVYEAAVRFRAALQRGFAALSSPG